MKQKGGKFQANGKALGSFEELKRKVAEYSQTIWLRERAVQEEGD